MNESQGSGDLSDLLARAQAGDEDAVRALQGLEHEIRLMVRVRLPQELRSQFDSMDFVQDVWQSFLRIFQEDPGRFRGVHNLRHFLAGVARNKVYEEHRRRTKTRKYDLGRQEPLYVRRGTREFPIDVPSQAPSPAQRAQAQDELAHLLLDRDPRAVQLLELRQEGLTFEAIAQRVGMHERTVRRFFESLKRDLKKDSGPDSEQTGGRAGADPF